MFVEPPEQLYVNAGDTPDSVHADPHRSMTSCSPLVPSVSNSDEGLAAVVSVTDERSSDPVLERSTLRWIVSPGAMLVALTFSRFVDAPVDPSAMVTVPDEIVCETLADPVNVA